MGFGYHQARAAGLDGLRQDRSPRQVNLEIGERKIARQLRAEVEKDPDWGPFVEHWVKSKLPAKDVLQALWNAQYDASFRRKGYHRLWKNRYAPF